MTILMSQSGPRNLCLLWISLCIICVTHGAVIKSLQPESESVPKPAGDLKQLETDNKLASNSELPKNDSSSATPGGPPSDNSNSNKFSHFIEGTSFIEPYGEPVLKQSTDSSSSSDDQNTSGGPHKKGDKKKSDRGFDDKAMQRAFMVGGVLLTIILAYLGIKYVCIKKRRPTLDRRYGKLETSEMDMLETIDDDDDDEDEADDTLFELNSNNNHFART